MRDDSSKREWIVESQSSGNDQLIDQLCFGHPLDTRYSECIIASIRYSQIRLNLKQ